MLREPVRTCPFSSMGCLHSGTYRHILYLQGCIVQKKKRVTYSPSTYTLLCSAKWKSHLRKYVSVNINKAGPFPWVNLDLKFRIKCWTNWMWSWSEEEVLHEWRDVYTCPQCGLKIQRQQERVHLKGIHRQEGKSTDMEQKVRPCGIIVIVQNITNNINHRYKLENFHNTNPSHHIQTAHDEKTKKTWSSGKRKGC